MAELGHILLADDEETFLRSTADLLRREGYECACAPDGAAAVKMLHAAEYDVLIADIKMPGNSDLELIQNLEDIAAGLPVIVVTGYPSVRSAAQSVQLPVIAYLVKPVDFDELLAHVGTATDYSRTSRAVTSAHQRLEHWCEELESIGKQMRLSPEATSSVHVSTFLDLTLRNILDALLDIKHLTEAISRAGGEQHTCRLLQCPRTETILEALKEAISVLEETKNAFKSRELGELRRKLEGIVNSAGNEPLTTR